MAFRLWRLQHRLPSLLPSSNLQMTGPLPVQNLLSSAQSASNSLFWSILVYLQQLDIKLSIKHLMTGPSAWSTLLGLNLNQVILLSAILRSGPYYWFYISLPHPLHFGMLQKIPIYFCDEIFFGQFFSKLCSCGTCFSPR